MQTSLLCTFTSKNRLDEVVELIKETYTIAFNRIYVLENRENKRELMCTYNINSEDCRGILQNTISIHRKKLTNTLYTIDALNEIVTAKNDGVKDSNFIVDWEDYRNSLLVTDEDGLKSISTKIYTIIEID